MNVNKITILYNQERKSNEYMKNNKYMELLNTS